MVVVRIDVGYHIHRFHPGIPKSGDNIFFSFVRKYKKSVIPRFSGRRMAVVTVMKVPTVSTTVLII